MTTLTDFLLARIAEDEAAADQKHDSLDCDLVLLERFGECSCGYPARVQAQCAAYRVIVEIHGTYHECADGRLHGPADDDEPSNQPCDTLRALASIYADHPDYDPAWRLT